MWIRGQDDANEGVTLSQQVELISVEEFIFFAPVFFHSENGMKICPQKNPRFNRKGSPVRKNWLKFKQSMLLKWIQQMRILILLFSSYCRLESLLRRAQNIVVNYVLSRRHGSNAKNNLWRFGDSCKELNNAWGNSIVEQHDDLLTNLYI